MKKLHYPVFTYTVYLTDGEKYSRKYMYRMKYSDADDREMNNKVYTIDELDRLIEENVVWCEKSLFKKNTYIRLHVPYEERYFNVKDVDRITIVESYEEMANRLTIEDIGRGLEYGEFLQFIFDKEQELKSVITSISK